MKYLACDLDRKLVHNNMIIKEYVKSIKKLKYSSIED